MSVIALIPARTGSKGIKNKNFRHLSGKALYQLACDCAWTAGVDMIAVSSDRHLEAESWWEASRFVPIAGMTGDEFKARAQWINRPAELASDSASMLSVVQHALEAIPGSPEDIIALLQPTQPLRKPEHVQEAIRLLRETQADSVVSVVEVPMTHNLAFQLRNVGGTLLPWIHREFSALPVCRQEVIPAYIRDGTVYAFWRKTAKQHGSIYGRDVRGLIIPPEDTCELDTEADWLRLVQRWEARQA